MYDGNEKMQELKVAIKEISNCSSQISSINESIEAIAAQTNLLSLNASIEAARAGEAGKGFAVVADEVKNLAEESTAAAGESSRLIEKTVQAIERGIVIADETVANMELVMESAEQATRKMDAISKLLDEESNNFGRIQEGVEVVSSIVDNNSATSEETAAVSQEQKTQVESLVNLIDKYEI